MPTDSLTHQSSAGGSCRDHLYHNRTTLNYSYLLLNTAEGKPLSGNLPLERMDLSKVAFMLQEQGSAGTASE